MKIQILNRFDLSVIFECEADSLSLGVKLAIEKKVSLSSANLSYADLSSANLSSANLRYADLRYADLRYANLSYADLRYADLRYANLSSANLSYADLSSANLSSANLSYADLRYADLRYANLSSANLSSANLSSANLSSANLSSANLSSAEGINKYRSTPLLILEDQPGPIRAYKLVNAAGEGPFNGGLTYQIGKSVSVKNANTDENKQCAEGVNLATLDWCMKEWCEGYKILIAEFTAKDIAAIPTNTDGKFRVHRCKIVAEVDLVKIGLEKEAK